MVLAIDVGNSITTVGAFDAEGKLRFRAEIATAPGGTRDQYAVSLLDLFRLYQMEVPDLCGSILSSVVPPVTAAMCGAVELLTGKPPLLVGPGVKTGLNIKSDIHAQMGSDLVALSVAAIAKYPTPIAVIDLGTATTVSVLSGNTYEGCIILPGVRVSLDALSARAAELPHISIEPPPSILGHNTVDAMRSGAVYGSAGMLDALLDRLEEEAGPIAAVVGTGLAAGDILPYCKRQIQHDAGLLLDGLYLIYKKSTEGKQRKA